MDLGTTAVPPRLRRLADESYLDFVQTFKKKVLREMYPLLWKVGDPWVERTLGRSGEDLPLQQIKEELRRLPIFPTVQRFWRSSQEMMWRGAREAVLADESTWQERLADAERRGPGKLIINPDFVAPDYARAEVHLQPGGYTDDPLGGPVFHYGTHVFYLGDNVDDAMHVEIADALAVPDDGRLRRVLDLGCSIGQATRALARRFPSAEVWGLDVARPMVRYAHWCATEQCVAVNFVQGLAERTSFPDEHFDSILAFILFHEVPWRVTQQIVPEAARLLRPGGTFTIFEFPNRGPRLTPVSRFVVDYDSHDNCEPYSEEFVQNDFAGLLRASGFEVREGRRLSTNSFLQSLVATKR